MDEKLKEDIKLIVASIFSEKEEAGQMQKTQEALNEAAETIENLTQGLEAKTTELADIKASTETEIAEKITKISEITAEQEAAQVKISELTSALASAEEALDNIKKDQKAEARMAELKSEKIANLAALDSQFAKVRPMSDEDFASYKTDRLELRNAVATELEAASKLNEDNNIAEKELNTEKASVDATGEIEKTPPVQIPVGQAMAAAMNFEHAPTDNVKSKYAKLGKSLADAMLNKKSE